MCPFVIIEDQEKLKKVIEGAVFYYKRIPGHVRSRLLTLCTSKRSGNIDYGKHGQLLIAEGIIGWEEGSVIDRTGNPIPFSKEILPYLPDVLQGQLIDLFGENIEQEDEEIKNLQPTPSSNSSTAV